MSVLFPVFVMLVKTCSSLGGFLYQKTVDMKIILNLRVFSQLLGDEQMK